MTTYNINRIRALFYREYHSGFKTALKVLLILILAIFLIGIPLAIFNPEQRPVNVIGSFSLILMIGGALLTSVAFYEFRKVSTRAHYLSLPGSSLEKMIVKWLYTNPIFILVTSLVLMVLASLFMPILGNFTGHYYTNEIFTSTFYWKITGIYFIIHSVFFLGSIAFNRVSFVKTILSLIVVTAVLLVVNAFFFRIAYYDYFDGMFNFSPPYDEVGFGVKYREPSEMPQVRFFIFIFKYLLAPVLWVASLFKLSEKEL